MRRLFLNRYGEPLFRFRLSRLFFAALWVAVVSSLHEFPWLAAGAGAILVIGYLHSLSLGRTSPAAAFVFVAFAAVAFLVAGFPYLVLAKGITDLDINNFFVAIVCLSLVVAALVAVVAAIEHRNEWFNHLR